MNLNKKPLVIASASLFCLSLVAVSFYGGYLFGSHQTENFVVKGLENTAPPANLLSAAGNISLPISVGKNEIKNITLSKEDVANFGVFWEAWAKIRSNYLKSNDVKNQDLIYGAIRGLAEGTGDPYTTFFTPEEAKKFDEEISGEFGGIGAELQKIKNQITVVAPLKGTPAERAGLKPKDIILKAGDTDLSGKEVEEAVKIIRGEPGTKIKLLIFSENEDGGGTKEIEITREIIKVPTVESEIKEGNIAYIRVYSFNEKAPELFKKALTDVSAKNPKGLIIDLRNNPGGLLSASVDMAGWFIYPNMTVVKERYASGEGTVFNSYGGAQLKDFPTVLLVNEGSASASEILAGALRDQLGIKLIGEKTFGKGTVQTLEELSDGSMIKITVANWVTPNGTILSEEGLAPDIEVKITEEDAKEKKDTQLLKAIEVLKKQIK